MMYSNLNLRRPRGFVLDALVRSNPIAQIVSFSAIAALALFAIVSLSSTVGEAWSKADANESRNHFLDSDEEVVESAHLMLQNVKDSETQVRHLQHGDQHDWLSTAASYAPQRYIRTKRGIFYNLTSSMHFTDSLNSVQHSTKQAFIDSLQCSSFVLDHYESRLYSIHISAPLASSSKPRLVRFGHNDAFEAPLSFAMIAVLDRSTGNWSSIMMYDCRHSNMAETMWTDLLKISGTLDRADAATYFQQHLLLFSGSGPEWMSAISAHSDVLWILEELGISTVRLSRFRPSQELYVGLTTNGGNNKRETFGRQSYPIDVEWTMMRDCKLGCETSAFTFRG